jgi:hypothetical protein
MSALYPDNHRDTIIPVESIAMYLHHDRCDCGKYTLDDTKEAMRLLDFLHEVGIDMVEADEL